MNYEQLLNKKLGNLLSEDELKIITNISGADGNIEADHCEKLMLMIQSEKMRKSNDKHSNSIQSLTVALVIIGIIQSVLMTVQIIK